MALFNSGRAGLVQEIYCILQSNALIRPQIAKFKGPTWGPPGSCRPQMGPMLAPWTLLSGAVQYMILLTAVAESKHIEVWTHKRQSISRLYGQAMGCLLGELWRNDHFMMALHRTAYCFSTQMVQVSWNPHGWQGPVYPTVNTIATDALATWGARASGVVVSTDIVQCRITKHFMIISPVSQGLGDIKVLCQSYVLSKWCKHNYSKGTGWIVIKFGTPIGSDNVPNWLTV